MRTRTWVGAVAVWLAMGGLAAPSAGAVGGPVVLGGDDLTDHGSVDGSGNSQLGWLYIERAIASIEADVSRTNDGSIAAFGSAASAATSGDAGAAIGNAAAKNGMTVQYFNGAASISSGMAQIAAGTYDPAIIWIAGNGALNDIDACTGAGTEGAAITAGATTIANFVDEGGGLMAHSACYQWLTSLVPALATVADSSSGNNDLYLTPTGLSAFPGLTNADIGAGPWHNYFQGDLGGLVPLARSNTVNDNTSADAAVIIGGDSVSLTTPPADLFLTMSDSPDPVNVGDNLTYTITVTNNGPNAATGVTVTDSLPAGVSFVSASSTQGTCTGTATVTCDIGALASGGSAIVTIVVQPTTEGSLSNTASTTSDLPDSDTGNNEATSDTTVEAPADLFLTMSDSPDPVNVGDDLTYTLTVTNNGPNPATGVTVTDPLPGGLSASSATASQGTCSGTTTITCDIGGLASGASAVVTIVVQPTAEGTLSNTASASGDQPDPEPLNNDAGADTTVEAPADLALSMFDSPDPVNVGDDLTYTLTVTNNGPNGATGVTVTDPLPGGLSASSATASQGSCSGTTTITCNLGSLADGASATVTIVVQPSAAGTLSNSASVSGDQPDPTPGNNDAGEDTTVEAPADLALTMSDAPDPVDVGSELTYTLTVTNNGPNTATGVTVTDDLPADVTLVSATPAQGSCSGTAPVSCDLGSVANGASVVITIVVRPTAAGAFTNTAEVSADGPDPTPGNNGASAETSAQARTDLAISVSDSPDPVTVGDDLTYTITAKNNGPQDATGVTVTGELPPDVTLVSASPSTGTCATTTPVSCSLDGLASGESATITVVVQPTAAGTLSTLASATGDQPDPDMSNNNRTAETAVSQLAAATRDRAAPRVRVSGVREAGGRRGCVTRAFTIRLTVRDASRLQRVAVFVDGERVRGSTRNRFAVRVPVRGLRAGPHRLVVIARDVVGNRSRRVLRFRRCAQAAPSPLFTG